MKIRWLNHTAAGLAISIMGMTAVQGAALIQYTFSEGSGSSSSNSGTLGTVGNLTFTPSATFSPLNEAPNSTGYSLDNRTGSTMGGAGGSAKTSGSVAGLNGLTVLTITGWYKTDGALAPLARLLDRADNTVGAGQWSLYFDGDPNNLQWNIGGSTFVSGPGFNITNDWVFFGVSLEGSTAINFYIGTGTTSVSSAGSLTGGIPADIGTTPKPLTIGNRDSGSRAFKGFLDDIRIYDEALSISDIENIRLAGIPEPATIGLLSVSLLFLARWRRIKSILFSNLRDKER